jgi:hypothetical protein
MDTSVDSEVDVIVENRMINILSLWVKGYFRGLPYPNSPWNRDEAPHFLLNKPSQKINAHGSPNS